MGPATRVGRNQLCPAMSTRQNTLMRQKNQKSGVRNCGSDNSSCTTMTRDTYRSLTEGWLNPQERGEQQAEREQDEMADIVIAGNHQAQDGERRKLGAPERSEMDPWADENATGWTQVMMTASMLMQATAPDVTMQMGRPTRQQKPTV